MHEYLVVEQSSEPNLSREFDRKIVRWGNKVIVNGKDAEDKADRTTSKSRKEAELHWPINNQKQKWSCKGGYYTHQQHETQEFSTAKCSLGQAKVVNEKEADEKITAGRCMRLPSDRSVELMLPVDLSNLQIPYFLCRCQADDDSASDEGH
jgi:hypothetical protein